MMIEIDGVFEGGGAKGTAYAGVLSTLRKMDIWFKRVSGTSAGAITAALIAAGYQAECDNEAELAKRPDYINHLDCIKGIVYNTNFNDFKDKPTWAFINLLKKSGFYKGDAFLEWIDKRLEQKLGIAHPTFSDLPIDLSVVASDITNQRFLILNKHTTPNLNVALAVRMSMSIPFFFRVVQWRGEGIYREGKSMRVVDGGLLSNYPIWLYNSDNDFMPNNTEEKNRPTVGFLLVEKPDEEIDGEPPIQDEGSIRVKKHKMPGGFSLLQLITNLPLIKDLGLIVNTLLTAHDNRYIKKSKWANTVPIFVNEYSTTQFDLRRDEKDDLSYRGQRAVERTLPAIMARYGVSTVK